MKLNLKVLILVLITAGICHAQAWSGVLSSSRAIDWTKAGLPATLPDGETTPNPWTPPTRTQCGSTITTASFSGMSSSNYVAPTAINTALASCGQGHYVYVAAGNYYFSGTITLGAHNGVSLRRADGAVFKYNTSPGIDFSNGSGATFPTTWEFFTAPSYSQGSNVIYLPGVQGMSANGSMLILSQCNDGYSAASVNACSGSEVDNGGILICAVIALGPTTPCSAQGASETINAGSQVQLAFVTAIAANGVSGCAAGSGNYCITLSPGLLMPNWTIAQTPMANNVNPSWGVGLEGGTDDMTGGSGYTYKVAYNYASWLYGVRAIASESPSTSDFVHMQDALNFLIANGYFFDRINLSTSGQEILVQNEDTLGLLINNVLQNGPMLFAQAGTEGTVFAYNYGRDGDIDSSQTPYVIANNIFVHHHPAQLLALLEGNQMGMFQDDSIHGSHALNTVFRNAFVGDPPQTESSTQTKLIDPQGVSRFDNAIGNVIADPVVTAYEQDAINWSDTASIYEIGNSNGHTLDPLTLTAFYRWGNYDSISGGVRWCGNSSDPGWGTYCALNPSTGTQSEVPTSLSGNAAPFDQFIPSNTTLPVSFFLGVSGAHSNGGTGLGWWKVCTNWTTFPTSCGTYQTPPFPPIGPDVSGGNMFGDNSSSTPFQLRRSISYAGHAYNIPAALAYYNAPIDPNYQASYGITASSWSGGVETITLSGFTAGPLGEFQIVGGVCAGTYFVLNTTGGNATFALASAPTGDPNACTTGTFKWPDIRQWSTAIYQNDPAGAQASPPSCTPTGGVVPQTVTCTNPNSGTTIMCYAFYPTTPATNGAGTACSTGTQYTTALAISSAETLNVIAGVASETDSSVVSYSYTATVPSGPSPQTFAGATFPQGIMVLP